MGQCINYVAMSAAALLGASCSPVLFCIFCCDLEFQIRFQQVGTTHCIACDCPAVRFEVACVVHHHACCLDIARLFSCVARLRVVKRQNALELPDDCTSYLDNDT